MEKNPFVWLSGADSDVLKQCIKLPKTERRKFAGFGTTVLIPATLGLFSMGYAISTFSNDPQIYITGGVLWFLIVLAIDRFLVSTLYKSSVQSKTSFWTALIFRLIFAVFVGIAVSHPLVLFLFDKSIDKTIDEIERNETDSRIAQINELKENAQKGDVSETLKAKTKVRDCLNKVLQAEQSGVVKGEVRAEDGTLCGYSSGIPECKNRCEKIQQQINELNKEIKPLNDQLKERVDGVGTITQNDVEKIREKNSRDYPARVRALALIEQKEPHIWWVKTFLMIFFVFIDSLLILLKGTTSMGEYEEIRDTLLFEVRMTQQAKKEAIDSYATTVYKSTVEAGLGYEAKKDEILTLINVTNGFIKEQEKQREIFDQQIKSIALRVKAIKDQEVRHSYLASLANIRDTFNLAWSKAMTKFQEYLKGL